MPFQNPVYPRSFPDPFVLKHKGEYWSYSTGIQKDGNVFGVLHSKDLVNWTEYPSAMKPIGDATCYWAPEVMAEADGSFLMYYSIGNEERMTIRVARSTKPQGPFEDCGVALTSESFAIDAHVFIDEDGSRYLFYATDFLDYQCIGTGTVRDRMLDPLRLEGKAVPVVRAKYDWQVYDPQRANKGNVKWHTVEGPYVLKRKGLYYMMFSGGNWQNISYGVSYATSNDIRSIEEWDQHADGERALPILKTIQGKVIGPGHNSVVRGPDNRQLYCVYHEWVNGERVLAIDPLDFVGNRLVVIGPSFEPQESPICARQISTANTTGSDCVVKLDRPNCLLELWLRADGECKLTIGSIVIALSDKNNLTLIRIELNGTHCRWKIGTAPETSAEVGQAADEIRIEGNSIAIEAGQLTYGFEEEFKDKNVVELQRKGWSIVESSAWSMNDQSLTSASPTEIIRGLNGLEHFEIVCNLRLNVGARENYACVVLRSQDQCVEIGISKLDSTMTTYCSVNGTRTDYDPIAIEHSVDYYQVRVRLVNSQLSLFTHQRMDLGLLAFSPDRVALASGGPASFEYFRITEIVAK